MTRKTELWRTYELLRERGSQFTMRKVSHRADIYPVFRELFARKPHGAAQGTA